MAADDGTALSDAVTITVTINGANDAPTAITTERLVLAPGQFNLGALSVTADPDQGQDAADYAFALATDAPTNDNNLFEIIGGELTFTGGTLTAAGSTYTVAVQVTDHGGTATDATDDATATLTLTITVGGVYVETGTAPNTTKTFTGGAGLLAENADADADGVDIDTTGDGTDDDKGIEIGTLGREGLTTGQAGLNHKYGH